MSETAAERKARILREEPSPEALKRAKERIYNPPPETVPVKAPAPAEEMLTPEQQRAVLKALRQVQPFKLGVDALLHNQRKVDQVIRDSNE